ncbi:MAG: hypothetical protein GTO63_15230 [Anaerolineae bacterium]|nr:hypothetical protein [Anaerolineae bacterium]NIN96183.1 hypothetical protein [Anaerolineae bacterium]
MEQLIELVTKGFSPAGAAVIVASWGVIIFLWRNHAAAVKEYKKDLQDERERNEALHEKRLEEAKSSLETVARALSTIRAMQGGGP